MVRIRFVFLKAAALLSLVFAASPLTAQQPTAPASQTQQPTQQRDPQTTPNLPKRKFIDEFALHSNCLSEFWGRDMSLVAGVVRPLDWKEGEQLPVCYNIHGFGADHTIAWGAGPQLQRAQQSGDMPRMLYVFLNAQCERGHHEFADSVNNGPCGRALITEFIPALEKKFGVISQPWARFVTGHSSGGWSSLWLQINYPDFFGGCWATSPDSTNFRDFTGIDIYQFTNAYNDPANKPIMLVRRGDKFVSSIKDYVEESNEAHTVGGQFYSFNAVFSPRANDGTPMQLFDWKTGAINPVVAESWRKYDLSLILNNNWPALAPKLKGKIHLWVGSLDTYRLEGPAALLKQQFEQLGGDADIRIVEGRDHGSIFAPHPEFWPKGMIKQIHDQMWAAYETSLKAHSAPSL